MDITQATVEINKRTGHVIVTTPKDGTYSIQKLGALARDMKPGVRLKKTVHAKQTVRVYA